MTCRHQPGDPNCSSSPERQYRELVKKYEALTPDSKKYQILDATQVGTALVLKVRYPNCSKCEYEGDKVIVYLKCTLNEVIYWQEIDPHFRRPKTGARQPKATAAPGPDARFPASPEGWVDALSYAKMKQ